MSDNNLARLFEPSRLMERYDEDYLSKHGLSDAIIEELHGDRYQTEGEGFVGALVLNYLLRRSNLSEQEVEGLYVNAPLFAQTVGMELLPLLQARDGDRTIVVERETDQGRGLYFLVSDIKRVYGNPNSVQRELSPLEIELGIELPVQIESTTKTELYAGLDETEKDLLDLYIDDVSRHGLIDPAEEVRLGKLAQTGDIEAIQALARANLRFVIFIAKQYQNRGRSLIDIIEDGNEGLMIAARKFDPIYGVKFISYAVSWIEQRIKAAFAYNNRIRVPLSAWSKGWEAKGLIERGMSLDDALKKTGLSESVYNGFIAATTPQLSLNEPIDTDEPGAGTLMDKLSVPYETGTDDEAFENARTEAIYLVMSDLEERDQQILRLYFGLQGEEEHTLEDIGAQLGVTRERIRQLRDRALLRMRHPSRVRNLEGFH